MQVDQRPDDCHICSKSTASSVSEKKKLTLLGSSAEPVRHILKCYILESLRITDFSFEEPQFHAGDYICSSCVTLLTSYDVGSVYPLRRSKTASNHESIDQQLAKVCWQGYKHV